MKTSPVSDYYHDYWEPREGWTPHPSISPLKRQIFSRVISQDTVALDVGCGDGAHYGKALAAIAREYHGLDVSESAVGAALQNGIRAQFHDLQVPFPFHDESFDTILCIEVLEHLFDPAYALGEMRRVLKPDGHIILSVPNIAHVANRVRALLGGFSPGGTPETSSRRQWADPHIRFFTLKSLRALISEQHLQLIELHGEGFSAFSSVPILSRLAARAFGWQRLEQWSQPLEFMARWWPSLCAGHFIAILKRAN